MPLLADAAYVSGEASLVEYDWRVEAGRTALKSGLSAMAGDIFESLFEDPAYPDSGRPEIALDYVAALIAQARYSKAEEVLSEFSDLRDGNRRNLYAASIAYGKAVDPDFAPMRDLLSEVEPNALSQFDRPWFHLLRGVLAETEGDSKEAEKHFQRAEKAASSSLQSALFSSLVLRQKILQTPTDENLLVEIREKFEALAGQSSAFPFLREYVVLLHGLGRDAEAIRVLETELAHVGAGYSIEERANLLLLKGLILGLDSSAGWASLKELVRAGIDSESTVIALQLLGSVPERDADLMALLNEIISRPEPHPLIAQLYYMRCQLALANPETTALAEADARYLLEQFPGLSEINSVYRLLAYAALQRDPPRYRVAADYLLGLRDQSSEPAKVAHLNRLIGDCYFLNRDYANAVDFYESARAGGKTDSGSVNVPLRLVISQIRSGRPDAALANIDQADFAGEMGDADRWRAEWSLALALQADGQTGRALGRLRDLTGRDTSPVPVSLDLRLRWLEAHLSLQLGENAGISEKLEALLARIDSLPGDALGLEESARLKSELLLLQAKSLIALGEAEPAFGLIETIRAEFRDNIAAKRTYFTESAYHASVGDFRAAQQVLKDFAADYPDSALVPQALFEASLHCQRQGPDSYGEAVVLLDRLVREYPDSELVYYSALKQGDLLRLMNDFAGAQLVYENLINRYPTHRLRYAAELSRADCIAALAQDAGDQLVEASAALERLVDRPDLPVAVQIEAGYKWGNILLKNEDPDAGKTVFALVASRFLFDSQNASALTPAGRYWLSRTIFSLGELLEDDGNLGEAAKLYRKLVAFNLPGRSLALSRISQLQLAESP
ncbi:MAG TPA: tetratricopeptide repeat protein [Opitutales bacterium]|nr:tetratricopeptide repeat protein [Opitutales bacterium]